jgi:hypothetical protein
MKLIMVLYLKTGIVTLTLTAFTFADVLMTELTDPENSSDVGRYVELYNNGDSDVDLGATGMALLRWTNGNADPTGTGKALTGTISTGGFYIVCNNADKFSATYGLGCDQDVGAGGVADSNGDDNVALISDVVTDDNGLVSYNIVDMFGVAGEDGSGTGHEFEDGRAERAEGVTAANATWDETEWNIDNDSGGGDGNQYAPEGFDPGEWIGATGGGDDSCDDEAACNTGAEGDCEYPDTGYDCDANCTVGEDCAGECGGDADTDECGICGGPGAIYECGCNELNEGTCDCDDNVVDACGECGGGIIDSENCNNMEIKTVPPQNYTMVNAYPNPFNSNTFITLQTMENTIVKLDIIDLNGHIIDSIHSGYLSGLNTHTFLWDGNGNNSGIYFARISQNNKIITHKIILLK